MLSFLLAAALGAFSLPPELAGVDHWTTEGPGGEVRQIVVDPASGVVYAVGYVMTGGVVLLKSTDSGRTWTPLAPQPDSSVGYGLAVDPVQAGHLLAANTFPGIARSIDGGSTWTQVLDNIGVSGPSVSAPFFDPSRPNVAYAAASGASGPVLYRSLDDGVSWTTLHPPVEAGYGIADLAASRDGTLFVAWSSNAHSGLLRSTDEGETWSPAFSPAPSADLNSLVADPVGPATLYAATSEGLFRSADGGDSWSRRGGGIATTLAIDPGDPATLYAAGSPDLSGKGLGVWKSIDTGMTWKMLSAPFPPLAIVTSLAISPLNSTLWAGTLGDGVFRSTDGGESWTQIGGGIPGALVTSIAVGPTRPETVYAGVNSLGLVGLGRVYRSDDAGGRWRVVLTESGESGYDGWVPSFTSLAVDPASPTTAYAGTSYCVPGQICSGNLFKSTDGGLSWSAVLYGEVTAIAIDPADPETLYVSTYVYQPCYGLGCRPFDGGGVASKSTDGGSTWTGGGAAFPAGFVSQWLIDPSSPETLYVASCQTGVFASVDGGATWEARNQGLTNLCVRSLARDPLKPGTLYAGTQVQGTIFKSTDSGMSWTPTSFTKDVVSLAFDPVNSTVFVGTLQDGVFRSLDGGATWTSFNDGLGSLAINALAIDSAGAYLHAATNVGVYDLRLRRLPRVVEFR